MTLADRLNWALDPSRGLKLSAAGLARACGIKPPSVSDWRSGKTGSIAAENLFKAARYLQVGAEWLGTGRGERERLGAVGPKNARSDELQLDAGHLVGTIKGLRLLESLAGREYTIDHIQSDPETFIEAYRRAVEIDARKPSETGKPAQGAQGWDGRIHDSKAGKGPPKRVATRGAG